MMKTLQSTLECLIRLKQNLNFLLFDSHNRLLFFAFLILTLYSPTNDFQIRVYERVQLNPHIFKYCVNLKGSIAAYDEIVCYICFDSILR